jgi:hypothetical protein
MALPRKMSTRVRYLPSSAFNSYITIAQPNAGQAIDGTPLGQAIDGTPLGESDAPIPESAIIASGVHANIAPWRSRELDKRETREGVSSYKIVIRYPKNYSLDTGCVIWVTRGGQTQIHNIDSFYDPDGQQVELHIWTLVTNDMVVNV